MSVAIILLVLLAGLLHAVWNALVKGVATQTTMFAIMDLSFVVVCWVALPFIGVPARGAWPFLVASVACHLGYQLFLLGSYQRASFSRAYPVARGAAPLLVTLGGLVFANEHIGLGATCGIILVVAGVISLSWLKGATSLDRLGIYWAIATGVAIAVYTVVDGLGVRRSHGALRYAVVLFVAQSSIWLAAVVWRRGWGWLRGARTIGAGLVAGVLSLVAYTIVLFAQTRAPLGAVSALRETGVVWAAVIGIVVFKEGRVKTLLIPAVVVAGGIALLSLT